MKNGLIFENGELIYYKNDNPYHAGVIEVDGDVYYIGRHGRAAIGQHVVHGEMTNGILKRGTYTFGEDGKLIKGSYIAPKKKTSKKKKSVHSTRNKPRKKLSKKVIALLAGFAATIVLLFVLAFVIDSVSRYGMGDGGNDNVNVKVTLPDYYEPVSLCSKSVEKLYRNEITVSEAVGEPYKAFEFEYSLVGADGMLCISENADMSACREYVLSESKSSVTIHNLKTGTFYYYTVEVEDEVYSGSFETAEGIRFVNIPGVYNTRDVGGCKTADGKRIRQGMIIRGTEMDGLVEADFFLSKEDVPAVQAQFGFVYDLDLREEFIYTGDYETRLGENVEHRFYGAPMYGNVFSEPNRNSLRSVFSTMADKGNYPMYLHCTYGSDRTGTIVYLLQGVLGMSEENMLREYQMSGFFGTKFATSSKMDALIAGLEKYEGDTINEKIETFLVTDIGVTPGELDSIRSILLED